MVDVLACLACGGGLDLSTQEMASDGHVMSGTLRCASCGAQFPVARGIPRLTEGALSGHVGETIEGFGYQWERGTALTPYVLRLVMASFTELISFHCP